MQEEKRQKAERQHQQQKHENQMREMIGHCEANIRELQQLQVSPVNPPLPPIKGTGRYHYYVTRYMAVENVKRLGFL